jgi:hypothetical protein
VTHVIATSGQIAADLLDKFVQKMQQKIYSAGISAALAADMLQKDMQQIFCCISCRIDLQHLSCRIDAAP